MSSAATSFHCFSSVEKLPPSSCSDQQMSLLSTKPKSILQKNPLYQPTQKNISLQFKEKILCLEIMGVDSGLHQKDFARIFGMCPTILTSDIKSQLNPVFNFLSNDLRVPEHNFRRVINKCPRLLVCSVKDQLKPALFYLQRLGFTDLHHLAYQDPILLVSSVENTLIPKLHYLISLGFSRTEAVQMTLRCPGLFTFSIDNNFNPKFDYFSQEMQGELDELKEFPQYFAFSLEKRIKPRHIELVQSGISIPLPLMLKTTDEEFKELIRQETG
ncbi:hypothetical protein RND71_003530 [Anisodus tanguticus]|uniref:Uncharacterized protein n=1 Tax=Anisodus tanguticus TaxID=243964 RepID=A0AAE1SUR7_9SOLA|nr:hypothetical protein RND71_003530 [Anisodus tanguticus]